MIALRLWNGELDSKTGKIRPPRLRARIPKRTNDIRIKNDIKVANVCFNLSYLDANFTKLIFNEASMRRASGRDFSRERRDRRRQENKFGIERIEVITLPLEYPSMIYVPLDEQHQNSRPFWPLQSTDS